MFEELPTVEVHGVTCGLWLTRYGNRRLCIRLIADNEPYACATVNVPDADLATNEVLIKNWSENRGVLQALLNAGIVSDTGRVALTGQVEANVVTLNFEPPALQT